jgi:predicted nucleotidyltransferase
MGPSIATPSVSEVLVALRAHEAQLRAHGGLHLPVFGSVARGEA